MRAARVLIAFLLRDLRHAASYRLQLFVQFASVVSVCLTFFFLSLMISRFEEGIGALRPYGGQYFGFAMVGLAVGGFLDASLRSYSLAIRQSQLTGTLSAMLQTGCPLGLVVAGSGLYPLLLSLARMGLFFCLAVGLFEVSVEQAAWGSAAVVMAMTVASTMVLGLMAAGFVIRFKQGDPFTAALSGVSWLVSGVMYPKEVLPMSVQKLADFLPLTHCLQAMRLAILSGASLETLGASLSFLVGFCLLGGPIALLWFGWCMRSAKRAGVLSHY